MAMSYGNVYVAKVAMGPNPQQTLLAMREAEHYPGPSIILAYCPCIAHGYDLRQGLEQQKKAVASGHWPLMRYNPMLRKAGKRPFVLDSPAPRIKLADFAYNEMRYKLLLKNYPDEAKRLIQSAQESLDLSWETYAHLAQQGPAAFESTM